MGEQPWNSHGEALVQSQEVVSLAVDTTSSDPCQRQWDFVEAVAICSVVVRQCRPCC